MNKICNKCGTEKDLNLFAKGSSYKDGRRNVCKKCHSDYMVDYYKNNDEQRKIKNKINSVTRPTWRRHKITEEQFNKMLYMYDKKCHACKTNDAVNIDHDHNCCAGGFSCGKCVRGILCHHCNSALGFVRDSEDTLNKLIKYLKTIPQ